MRKIPIAVGMMIGGIMGIIFGAMNNAGFLITCSGVLTLGGWIWFTFGWAELMKIILPLKGYNRRVRKMKQESEEYKAERAALDSAFNRKMDMLNKRHGQNVNGYLAKDGQIIEFSNGRIIGKEETA